MSDLLEIVEVSADPVGREPGRRRARWVWVVVATAVVRQQFGTRLATVLKEAHLVASTSVAYRMIEQGAVRLDGAKVSEREMTVRPGGPYLLQVGKRGFARVTLRAKA